MIIHEPLSFWVNKVETDDYFSLGRYGDGELLCVEGRGGANSHGCYYTKELREDLIESMEAPILHGLQRILPEQLRRHRDRFTNDWYDTEVFADELALGNLKPWFTALARKNPVIISSAEKQSTHLPHSHFIEVPRTNAHTEKERVVEEIRKRGPGTYLFACGMAAATFVSALHGMPKTFLIDIGHVLDPFLGENSRVYLNDVPKEVLNRNL